MVRRVPTRASAEATARPRLGRLTPAQERLVLAHDDLVRGYAKQFAGAGEWQDLLQIGRMGLVEAARRYEPARGVPFKTYAAHWVRGMLSHHWRIERKRLRMRTVELTEMHADTVPDATAIEATSVERVLVRDLLVRLRPRDRWLLWLRFASDLRYQDVAHRLGVPVASMSQMLHRARTRAKAVA